MFFLVTIGSCRDLFKILVRICCFLLNFDTINVLGLAKSMHPNKVGKNRCIQTKNVQVRHPCYYSLCSSEFSDYLSVWESDGI